MSTEQHAIDLIPEYALGLLSDQDIQLVERYLETNSRVRSELDSYNQTLDALALSIPLVELPPALKSQVMHEVQLREGASAGLLANGHQRAKPVSEVAESASILHFEPAQQTQRFNLTPAFLVASLVANVVLVGVLLTVIQPNQNAVVAEVAPTQTPYIITAEPEIIVQEATPLPAPTQPPAEATPETVLNSISLVNSSNTEHGLIILSDDGAHGTLIVSGLPVLEAGEQYQIWLSDGESIHNGGLFIVTDNGYAAVAVEAPLPLNSYSQFGILLESQEEAASSDLILQNTEL